MPCTYDDVPGSWGKQSEGWPAMHDPDGRARMLVIKEKLVPYGSYVTVGDMLRLERQEYVDKVSAALSTPQARPDGGERATHRCEICTYEGTPDPVVGCPRCKWDAMQPIDHTAPAPDVARLVGLMREVVPALRATGVNVSLADDVERATAPFTAAQQDATNGQE